MRDTLVVLFFAVLTCSSASGQSFEKLKLTDSEIPEGYKRSKKMLYKSVQAVNFYEQTDLYSFLGEVKNKAFESYERKGDKGGIYYYEFEDDFEGEGFLEGLLWGESDKPTKAHPEEYFVNGNLLVIWSFAEDSELKKVSKAKVTDLLK